MNETTTKHQQLVNQLRVLWHPLFYRLMQGLLRPINVKVEDEFQLTGESPKSDLIFRHDNDRWTEEQRAVLPDGIRDCNLQHHQIEFKVTESLTTRIFKQAFMYDFLYPQKADVKEDEFQTYIVSSKTPQAKSLTRWGYKEGDYPGVYISTLPAFEDIILLVLNELRDAPHNNYFRLFASRRKVRQAAFEYVLQTHNDGFPDDGTTKEILAVLFALAKAYEIEVEGGDMEHEMTIDRLFEMGDGLRRTIIATASLEERMYGLKPEERVMGLKPEELFTMFRPQERVMGLRPEEIFTMFRPEEVFTMYKPEERVMGLKPEERVMGLKPEERVMGLKPEERMIGLSREDKRLLMEELERSLQEEEPSNEIVDGDEIEAPETITDEQITEDTL